MTFALALDNGPTETQWREYTANGEKYLAVIERCVGLFMFLGCLQDDRDFPSGEAIASHIPALAELTEDEQYFVYVASLNVMCHHGASDVIHDMTRAWLADGAPE